MHSYFDDVGVNLNIYFTTLVLLTSSQWLQNIRVQHTCSGYVVCFSPCYLTIICNFWEAEEIWVWKTLTDILLHLPKDGTYQIFEW